MKILTPLISLLFLGQQRSFASDPNVCFQEKSSGLCKAYLLKWYYNSSAQRCEEFVYGGCGGNANRFETEDACTTACSNPRCQLPLDAGPCRANYPLWFHNSMAAECQPFQYSGCGGNLNKFDTKDLCEESCPSTISGTSSGTKYPTTVTDGMPTPIKVSHQCLLENIPGQCRAYVLRWFYSSAINACRQFVYGGCGGNENNFESEYKCKTACAAFTTPSSPPTDIITSSQSRITGFPNYAIVIVVVCLVLGFVKAIFCGCCFLMKRRRTLQDKQGLFYSDPVGNGNLYEQLDDKMAIANDAQNGLPIYDKIYKSENPLGPHVWLQPQHQQHPQPENPTI